MTNLRRGISPAVDLQGFISKCGQQLPLLNELIHPRFPDYTRCLKAEITSVGKFGRGSSLSTVGCRCQVDGFAGVPRNE
jgi:hypothetical protein